jgi:hypothetical protein
MDPTTLLYGFASALILAAVASFCLAAVRSATHRTQITPEPEGLIVTTVQRASRRELLLPGLLMMIAASWLTSTAAIGAAFASLFAGVATALVIGTFQSVHRTRRLTFDRRLDQVRDGTRICCALSAIEGVRLPAKPPFGLYLEYRDQVGKSRRLVVSQGGRESDYVQLKRQLDEFLGEVEIGRTSGPH